MADFSRRARERIRRVVRDAERERPLPRQQRRKYPVGGGGQLKHAKLTAALAAAGSGAPLTDATTATAILLKESATKTDPKTLEEGREITVVNRSKDLTGASGDYCIVSRVNGEWAVIAKDC